MGRKNMRVSKIKRVNQPKREGFVRTSREWGGLIRYFLNGGTPLAIFKRREREVGGEQVRALKNKKISLGGKKKN